MLATADGLMTGVLSRCSRHSNTGRRGSDYFGTYPQLFRHLVSRFLPLFFLSLPSTLYFSLVPQSFFPPRRLSSLQQLLLMLCSVDSSKGSLVRGREQEGEIFLSVSARVLLYTGNKALHHLARHFERSPRLVLPRSTP